MNDKLKPAMIGGVVLGLLSVIPFVNLGNICCCLWAIVGGMLGTYLYVKNSPTPVSVGDGAMVGLFAGLVGAVISIIVGIPIEMVMGPVMRNMMVLIIERLDPRQADIFRQQFQAAGQSIGSLIFGALFQAVFLFVFSIIGGLLGVPIFEKRKGDAPPPPPPINVGGGPGGYGI